MNVDKYLGHKSQLYGVEEHRLIGGKGDGMRLLEVNNGQGLQFTVSADRCADISRLSFKGVNIGYFSPCGYVASTYYDDKENGFLKSFTAGFLTTCGLRAVGTPCTDMGERLPLHGTIGNTPAEHIFWEEYENDKLLIKAEIHDECIFSDKLVLYREISCSLKENRIKIRDRIVNKGSDDCPVMILYHMNVGYPLLNEESELCISSNDVQARDIHAEKDIAHWESILPPQKKFTEQCYFHSFSKEGKAAIFDKKTNLGIQISFDAEKLPYFTQWKMFAERDYVMGLEPGNCHPDGRDLMRKEGKLTFLKAGEEISYEIALNMIDGREAWKQVVEEKQC